MTYWSISSQVLKEEAEKIGFKVDVLVPEKNFFIISSPTKSVLFKSTDFWVNTALGKKIADDKELTYTLLSRHSLPIPQTLYLNSEELDNVSFETFEMLWFPVIIKPVDGAHGKGVLMDIRSPLELIEKLKDSFQEYPRMIVQEQVSWDECRVLVVLGKVLLGLQRIPPTIVWDGVSTIKDLIGKENVENPLRKKEYNAPLSTIEIDQELLGYIEKQGFALESILPSSVTLQLRWNSNLGTGGTARDITHLLHDETKRMCIEIADRFWLGICGIDILSEDFSKPLPETGWMVLEVNATPGIWWDRELTSVNTGREILRLLFGDESNI